MKQEQTFKPCVHFVGVTHPAIAPDYRYDYMVRFFGEPDFVHRRWDVRARQEIVPGDVAVFADGNTIDSDVTEFSFDDSALQ